MDLVNATNHDWFVCTWMGVQKRSPDSVRSEVKMRGKAWVMKTGRKVGMRQFWHALREIEVE